MRNLKRALSLALAFVMVMSLMIVGTSAKSYTDADKIDNQVAVEILGEIGVMIGNDDGSFAPDRDVTRAEMAVIITRILYGNNMNVDQFKNMNTFTDVPDWAEGFVNLCASLDIIAGRGNGIFDPDATVTSAEAALMLSRALGYFKNNAEFGNDWALAAMKRATQVGIIGGDMVLQANAGLDRDDVAQMTFNTLTKAVPVQYNELLDVYYNVNQGVIYALEFNYLQTLGYTNFNLVYKSNQTVEYGRPATTWGIGSYKDAGAGTASGIEKADLTPAGGLIADNVRMLEKDEITTVNNTPVYVYNEDTAEKDVYSNLGADVCTEYNWWNKDGYTWTAYINGAEQRNTEVPGKNDTNDYRYTAKGSVTEIYVDDYAATVTVVEINYYLGQVSKVNDGEATIRPLSAEGKTLDEKTFATDEFNKGDYVVFTIDRNSDNDFYICELMAPETMTGEVTRVEKHDDSQDSYVRLDGESTQYYYTSDEHMVYDVSAYDDNVQVKHPDLNKEYVFYMTPDGFILGFELANKVEPQYLYVENSDEELRNWVADVILPDATEPEVKLDRDLGNTAEDIHWIPGFKLSNIDTWIWDYTVDSDGVYSLSYVAHKDEVTNINKDEYQAKLEGVQINNGESYIKGTFATSDFIIDNDTIFVDTMNHKAYTGYNEVPDVVGADIAYVVEDGVAQIIYILKGTIYDENSIYFMLSDADCESLKYDGDTYYEYFNAYVDGEKQTMNVSYEAIENLQKELIALGYAPVDYLDYDDGHWVLQPGVLYQSVMSKEDGKYITEIHFAGPETNNVISEANGSFRISTLPAPVATINTQKFDVNDETVFVLVEYLYNSRTQRFEGYKITQGDEDDLFVDTNGDGYNIYVDVVERDGQTAELVYMTYCKTIEEHQVTVDVENATVEISGNNFALYYDEDGTYTFNVQDGTYMDVVVKANDGYVVEHDGQMVPTYTERGKLFVDYTVDAVAQPAERLVALTADSEHVTMQDEEGAPIESAVIDAENGTTVTLTPDDGYRIADVTSETGDVVWTANLDGTVTVTVPGSTSNVNLKVVVDTIDYKLTQITSDDAAVSGVKVNDIFTVETVKEVTITADKASNTQLTASVSSGKWTVDEEKSVDGFAGTKSKNVTCNTWSEFNMMLNLANAAGSKLYVVDTDEVIENWKGASVKVYYYEEAPVQQVLVGTITGVTDDFTLTVD